MLPRILLVVLQVVSIAVTVVTTTSSFTQPETPAPHTFATMRSSKRNAVQLTFRETDRTNDDDNDESNHYHNHPPTLFLHGLDSSSHTWKGVLTDFGDSSTTTATTNECNSNSNSISCYRAVALDQRGCGRSPLGNPDLFSPEALVDDIHAFLGSHPYFCCASSSSSSSSTSSSSTTTNNNNNNNNNTIRPFVLVGHSMGGRVAMSFAARYPELICALVIEDMDIQTRSLSQSHVQSRDHKATLGFDRELGKQKGTTCTKQDVLAAFAAEGYPESQVQKWLDDGNGDDRRVEHVGTDHCYSHVNPAFRLLCYQQFFETNHGRDTWEQLARTILAGSTSASSSTTSENENDNDNDNDSTGNKDDNGVCFPIHLMVADLGLTVCNETSIAAMKDIMESATTTTTTAATDTTTSSTRSTTLSSSPRLTIHRYEGATHSIHNSKAEEFLVDLKAIIKEASN